MSFTTSSQYQNDLEAWLAGFMGMTAYPSAFDSVAQVLAPATNYFAAHVQQDSIDRAQDSDTGLVSLAIRLRIFYRFTTNEAQYLGATEATTAHRFSMLLLMDEKFWRGNGGLFVLTSPLDVHEVTNFEATTDRVGRVITTDIGLSLTTTSV
jgi:hypothetical protein